MNNIYHQYSYLDELNPILLGIYDEPTINLYFRMKKFYKNDKNNKVKYDFGPKFKKALRRSASWTF